MRSANCQREGECAHEHDETFLNPEQKSDAAADVKAIGALHDRYAAVFNANDAAEVAAYYTNDAVLMLPGMPAIEGRSGIQALFESYFKENAARIKHTPLEVEVAGDWAYERGNIAETVTPRSGRPAERSLKYLAILHRQADGAWKIHLDIDNSNW